MQPMTTLPLPRLPDELPRPLPINLRWGQVISIFEFWNYGSPKNYLLKLVASGAVKPVTRPHVPGEKLYPTEQVLMCCPKE